MEIERNGFVRLEKARERRKGAESDEGGITQRDRGARVIEATVAPVIPN